MDPISLEDLFSPLHDEGPPGDQLYLYRFIHLLASEDSPGAGTGSSPYLGAKQLAARIGINSPERLENIFRNVGLGQLKLEINQDWLRATVRFGPAIKIPEVAGGNSAISVGCDFERGLIDGALEMITGMQVTTADTGCWARGDSASVFEAFRDRASGRAYLPGKISDIPALKQPAAATGCSRELRLWFMDLTERELARARRHSRHLSLLYLDLDDLAQINLSLGSSAGDQIIGAAAETITRVCRTEDAIWHHGEDEFVVVLSDTGTKGAEVVAHRLSNEVPSAARSAGLNTPLSASIGLSTFPTHAENVPGLFASARSALYLAKYKGKGKVEIAQGVFGRVDEAGDPHAETRETNTVLSVSEDSGPVYISETPGESPLESFAAPGEKPVSVVIASASPLLLAGMRQVLAGSEGTEIVAEVTDPNRLPLVIDDIRPDLVFADLNMAMANEFAIVRIIEAENLACKLAISVSDVDQDVIKLVADYSVDGVITQHSSQEEVLSSIRRIYQGKTVLPEEVEAALAELESKRKAISELSEREIEVLRLVAEGKSNSQISAELFITVNTVRFHLANIYQKLAVSNRTEAANYFLRQDLASDSQTKLL